MKIVIELLDGMPDDDAHDDQRRRLVKQMVVLGGRLGDGVLDLTDGGNVIGARVVGVAVEVNAANPGKRYRIDPL